jgi:hypothetical protein
MEYERRIEILNAIKGVIKVDSVDDVDDTVCEAIRRIRPTYFANGGDRGTGNTPEVDVCKEMNIKLLWGIGGNEKLDGPNTLTRKTRDFEVPPRRGLPKSSSR